MRKQHWSKHASTEELNRRLEQQTLELNHEREAIAEERRLREASQQWEAIVASGGKLEAPIVAEREDETPDFVDEQRLNEGKVFEAQQVTPDAAPPDAAFEVEGSDVASGDSGEADVERDRRESTPEERAAAAFRLLGIRPEDRQEESECPEPQAIADQRPVAQPMEPSVLEQAVVDEMELPDDSAIRFARLRAEAMGTAVSAAAASAPAANVPKESVVVEPARAEDSLLEDSDRPVVSRVAVDKEEVRENLRSLREVSQLSTQSALNLHQSKRLRNSIVMRSLTAFVCFAGAVAFLSGDLAGYEMFWMQGTVFLVVGIYMAFDAFQKTVQLGVITARRRAGRQTPVPEAAPQETEAQLT